MQSLTQYFAARDSGHKYHIGTRVEGVYENIPFVGTVAVDHLVYVDSPRLVAVFLDLPMKVNGEYKTIISLPQKKVKLRK